MNERPFYSPRTPTSSHRVSSTTQSFPFPSSPSEDSATVGLLQDEGSIGFERGKEDGNEEGTDEDDDELNLDELEGEHYGNGSVTPQEGQWDGNTPLDETLEKIGMGRYQWTLLVLCGCGWAADNMWLQCVAVILPRVQEHYAVSDRWIGLLSASIFAGMMIGAWGWGSYSDAQGRTPAFNLTLLLTAIFGIAAAFAPSFQLLCFALFGLGSGIGGSMPTDGTLFLENIPKTHHYLLTALSTFFSLGAVLTSILGLYFIPRYSCPEHPIAGAICNVEVENNGWRYILLSLGVISVIMFLARIALFRLQESAKFLMNSNRTHEAIIALTRISRINGEPQVWLEADVFDKGPSKSPSIESGVEGSSGRGEGGGMRNPGGGYDANGDSPEGSVRRDSFIDTSTRGTTHLSPNLFGSSSTSPRMKRPRIKSRLKSSSSRVSERVSSWIDSLPPAVQDSIEGYKERIDGLFQPEWRRTTLLVWAIWFFASVGYTIFNVFLPKYLEEKMGKTASGGSGRAGSLKEYVMYTISGMPGSLIGAYLIETDLGRRGTMALATLATSAGIFIFVLVDSQVKVVLSSMAVSLAATLMYAVIYGYTPEVFPSSYRGTACGIASAFSRLAGVIAPVLTGLFLSINVSLPLYAACSCFLGTTVCMVLLPIETRVKGEKRRVIGIGH